MLLRRAVVRFPNCGCLGPLGFPKFQVRGRFLYACEWSVEPKVVTGIDADQVASLRGPNEEFRHLTGAQITDQPNNVPGMLAGLKRL